MCGGWELLVESTNPFPLLGWNRMRSIYRRRKHGCCWWSTNSTNQSGIIWKERENRIRPDGRELIGRELRLKVDWVCSTRLPGEIACDIIDRARGLFYTIISQNKTNIYCNISQFFAKRTSLKSNFSLLLALRGVWCQISY